LFFDNLYAIFLADTSV